MNWEDIAGASLSALIIIGLIAAGVAIGIALTESVRYTYGWMGSQAF